MRFESVDAFHKQDRSVSSVIGVVLMVGITVIVAAVIGSSVLGMTETISETPPQTQFEFSQETEEFTDNWGSSMNLKKVTVTHAGGEDVSEESVHVVINGERVWGFFEVGFEVPIKDVWGAVDGETTISTGDSATFIGSSDAISTDYTTYEGLYERQQYYAGSPSSNTRKYKFSGENMRESNSPDDENIQLESGDEVKLVWAQPGGDQSAILAEYTVE